MSSSEVVPAEPERTALQVVTGQIRSDQFRQQLELALPEGVPARRVQRAAITALMERPELAEADPSTLLMSLIRCATDGLLPDGREAVLNVYRTKVKRDGRDQTIQKAEYLPMIGGYRKIAAEHGWEIVAAIVYANDEFSLGAPGERPTHVPTPITRPRGAMIAVWGFGRHRDGRVSTVEVMRAEEVEKIRRQSKQPDGKLWKENTDRAWLKTIGRRIFKALPLDQADRRVSSLAGMESAAHATQMLYGGAPALPALAPGAGSAGGGETLPLVAAGGGPAAADQQAGGGGPTAEPDVAAGDDAGAATPVPGAEPDGSTGTSTSDSASGDPLEGEPAGDEEVVEGEVVEEPGDDGGGVAGELVGGFPKRVVDAAIAAVIPRGKMQGKTLGDIGEREDGGREWLTFALGSEDVWPEEFLAHLHVFVRALRPVLWAELRGEDGAA